MPRKVYQPSRIYHPLIFDVSEPDILLSFADFQSAAYDFEIVEFGFGKGKFIIDKAVQKPDAQFLAIENSPGLFFPVLKKAAKHKLTNLLLALGDARLTAAMYLPEECTKKLCFMFPDPWPKTKHYKRRMISAPTSPYLLRLLKPEGEIIIRSDNHIVFYDALVTLVEAKMKIKKVELSLFRQSLEALLPSGGK